MKKTWSKKYRDTVPLSACLFPHRFMWAWFPVCRPVPPPVGLSHPIRRSEAMLPIMQTWGGGGRGGAGQYRAGLGAKKGRRLACQNPVSRRRPFAYPCSNLLQHTFSPFPIGYMQIQLVLPRGRSHEVSFMRRARKNPAKCFGVPGRGGRRRIIYRQPRLLPLRRIRLHGYNTTHSLSLNSNSSHEPGFLSIGCGLIVNQFFKEFKWFIIVDFSPLKIARSQCIRPSL